MKILTCPVNGPRPIQEFTYGGEVREIPASDTCSDEEWADYVFNRTGEPGVRREWWYHAASTVWFIAERDVVRDEVIQTYLWSGGKGS
jgi:sarcosine oxidase subunit delta